MPNRPNAGQPEIRGNDPTRHSSAGDINPKLNSVSAEHLLADVLAKLVNSLWRGGMSLNTTAIQIKGTLKDVKPEVMLRLVVPVTLRLDRLHQTLQAAFGWTISYLLVPRWRRTLEDPGS
ncbi:hypothetical protein ACVIGB_008524 [Bradyrhizobium sp. USDA 4341]